MDGTENRQAVNVRIRYALSRTTRLGSIRWMLRKRPNFHPDIILGLTAH